MNANTSIGQLSKIPLSLVRPFELTVLVSPYTSCYNIMVSSCRLHDASFEFLVKAVGIRWVVMETAVASSMMDEMLEPAAWIHRHP